MMNQMNKVDSAINALVRLKKKYTTGPFGGGSPSESTMNSIGDFKEVINTINDLQESIKEKDKMLEFFFDQMKLWSPSMNGQHTYTFTHGWPMTHCVGPTREDAVKNAMKEVDRSKKEMNDASVISLSEARTHAISVIKRADADRLLIVQAEADRQSRTEGEA
jgi:hypothetical protein